jgi:glycosyltransferase involved in cell wall biosynthesis
MQKNNPKIALVHDFLIKLGGAERVLKELADIFPQAPIFTLLYDKKAVKDVFLESRVRPSELQNKPGFLRKRQKYLLPYMPRAIEKIDLSPYDIVISSSSAFAHGIITNSHTKHICYCHSPMRYAWDWTHEYIKEQNFGPARRAAVAMLLKKIRMWDQIAKDRPDKYIANSKNVQKRIKKYYRKDSNVIYPPVDIKRFKPRKKHENYFLIVSTLTPYKRVDLAVNLFNKTGKQLVIIGDGPQKPYLQSMAASNISFLGFKDDKTTAEYFMNCRALIFPGEEDFGITPVEAMACGKPVLAYGRGGVTESVIPGVTGEFFFEPTVESMEDGLGRLITNENNYRVTHIRKQAEKFDKEIFINAIKKEVETHI